MPASEESPSTPREPTTKGLVHSECGLVHPPFQCPAKAYRFRDVPEGAS